MNGECYLKKLTYMVNIYKTLKLIKGYVHKIKGQTHDYKITLFAYNSWTMNWIFIKLIFRIDINEMLKLTQGQGHEVKDQGQTGNTVKQNL